MSQLSMEETNVLEQNIANAVSAISFLMITPEVAENTRTVAKLNRIKIFINSLNK